MLPEDHDAMELPPRQAAPIVASETTSETATTATAPRVFVSHSSLDNALALPIVMDLRRELGSEDAVWFDASGGLHAGDGWQQRIEHELTGRDVFVVLLSPNAVQAYWVRLEIALALQMKKVIVPVLLQTCEVSGFLTLIQHVSFVELSYPKAFDELVFAVHHGQTRMREVEQTAGIRLGPPMEVLPRADRFIGRQGELEWVLERLRRRETASITSLTGLAGIGKTALAAEAIKTLSDEHLFGDGIAVVGCLGRTDAIGVLRDVLSRFISPFSDEAIPEDADLARLSRMARELLEHKHALVVLDNVEPELEVAQVVGPLRALGVSLLLTARATLPRDTVPPGSDLELALLPPEKALELFATSYGLGGIAALDATSRALAERIVAALGCHTLALVLAARYALGAKRPLDAVAHEMEDPQRALDLPKDGTPEGVRRAFASSVESLPKDARMLFAALATFATPEFGRQAAVALAEGLDLARPEYTVDLLVRRALADNALSASMPEQSDRERLRLHPLLYAYANYLLTQPPLTDTTRRAAQLAVARWYAAYAGATLAPALVADEENIGGALHGAHAQTNDALVVALATAMRAFWRERSRNRERRRYLPWGIAAAERIADRSQTPDDRLALARLLLSYGELLLIIGRTQDAEQHVRRSLDICRAVGATREEGVALAKLGDLLVRRGDLAGAQANYERYLQIMRAVGDPRGEGVARLNLGQLAAKLDQLEAAEDHYSTGLHLLREGQETSNYAIGARVFGAFLIERRDRQDEGCFWLHEAIRLYAQMGLAENEEEARETARRLNCLDN